jgi:hypothetical protein
MQLKPGFISYQEDLNDPSSVSTLFILDIEKEVAAEQKEWPGKIVKVVPLELNESSLKLLGVLIALDDFIGDADIRSLFSSCYACGTK